MLDNALSNVNEWYLIVALPNYTGDTIYVLFDLTILLFNPKLHSYLTFKGLFKPAKSSSSSWRAQIAQAFVLLWRLSLLCIHEHRRTWKNERAASIMSALAARHLK